MTTSGQLPENRFLYMLKECQNTLIWLRSVEPVAAKDIPSHHVDNLKKLERVGIVFWRNRDTAQLRRQRLNRIAEKMLAECQNLTPSGTSAALFSKEFAIILADTSSEGRGGA